MEFLQKTQGMKGIILMG